MRIWKCKIICINHKDTKVDTWPINSINTSYTSNTHTRRALQRVTFDSSLLFDSFLLLPGDWPITTLTPISHPLRLSPWLPRTLIGLLRNWAKASCTRKYIRAQEKTLIVTIWSQLRLVPLLQVGLPLPRCAAATTLYSTLLWTATTTTCCRCFAACQPDSTVEALVTRARRHSFRTSSINFIFVSQSPTILLSLSHYNKATHTIHTQWPAVTSTSSWT